MGCQNCLYMQISITSSLIMIAYYHTAGAYRCRSLSKLLNRRSTTGETPLLDKSQPLHSRRTCSTRDCAVKGGGASFTLEFVSSLDVMNFWTRCLTEMPGNARAMMIVILRLTVVDPCSEATNLGSTRPMAK